jgi:hypothetical protein
MRNRVLTAVAVVFMAGGFIAAAAQQTTRLKSAEEVTPSWTYKGQWYGFITCSKLIRQGNSATPEDIKKCIDGGGTYILAGGGRMDLLPADKAAAYAGQQVLITGTITSQRYGTGPTSDTSIEGLYAGGDRPATKFQGITIISVKPMPPEPKRAASEDIGSRVSETAQ